MRQPAISPKAAYREPIPWVIVVDAMDYEKAAEVGRALGGLGVTGLFMAGDQAAALKRLADFERARKREGEGGEHGDEGVHEARP